MLILILIDVQYSQKTVFSFGKGFNGQNHSSSGSHHLVKKSLQAKFLIPPLGGLLLTRYCYLENPALRDLVQFKKHEKHPWKSVTFRKISGFSLQLY